MLKEWTIDFDIRDCTPDEVPVWIQFPNLDMKFWCVTGISKLASSIGYPLMMDQLIGDRGEISFAGVLVRMKVGKPIKDCVCV